MRLPTNLHPALTARASRRLRLGVVAWGLVWLAIGILTAVQIWQLARLSETVVQAGKALEAAGSGLRVIGRIPVIGEGPRTLGEEVGETAEEIQDRGAATRSNVRTLSVLLGVSIVVIPLASILGWYLPLRAARERDKHSIQQAFNDARGNRAFEQFLAWRALQHLPYETLKQVTTDPWGDFEGGRYRFLANAELTRLGLAGATRAPERDTAPRT